MGGFYSLNVSETQNAGGVITQQIIPNIVYSTGGWSNTPTSLSAISDNDDATSTTQGEAGGTAGATGTITLDLSQEYGWVHGIFKIGIEKPAGWSNQESNWGIDYSNNNLSWTTCWAYVWRQVPAGSETIINGNFTFKDTTRYLRFFAQDVGRGGAKLRVYTLKLYTLA